MPDKVKLYVSMALFARETARRYRRLKRKYIPNPKHVDHLEREARACYRQAVQWVDRARVARCEATV
jgi:hypothetical protein